MPLMPLTPLTTLKSNRTYPSRPSIPSHPKNSSPVLGEVVVDRRGLLGKGCRDVVLRVCERGGLISLRSSIRFARRGGPNKPRTQQKVDKSTTFVFHTPPLSNKFATEWYKTQKGVEFSTPFCFV